MKLYFDTEFTGLHRETSLISIGIIDDNGRYFYAELTDYKQNQVDSWIKKNVINNLLIPDKLSEQLDLEKENIVVHGDKFKVKKYLLKWLEKYDKIQFVSDCSTYDFMLLIDLICGHALKLPKTISPYCHDINQDLTTKFRYKDDEESFDKSREEILNENDIKIPLGIKHNSLYDAMVLRELYKLIYTDYELN